MIGNKNFVFYLAALHMVIVSTYGKVLEIVNNKPQLKERRKITIYFHWFWITFMYEKRRSVEYKQISSSSVTSTAQYPE